MPVLFQSRIYRADCEANAKQNVLYVFGDNVLRKGMGGQAGEMRGAPNTVGVATKWAPTSASNAYFSDEDFAECIKVIELDLEPVVRALEHGATVIIPLDGLGTGLSELPTRAPKIDRYIKRRIQELTKLQPL